MERAYQRILGREIDRHGLEHYSRVLAEGQSRLSFLGELVLSDEFLNRALKEQKRGIPAIKEIVHLRPFHYHNIPDTLTGNRVLTFKVERNEDFDWLESMIIENNYYEKDGVWGVVIDLDKRVMAEIITAFNPTRALEIGCANGAIIQCLHEMGTYCEGVEISQLAIDRAFLPIKDRVHQGDLLQLELASEYDLVFGLDIFEHLNPNKLDDYVSKLYTLMLDGGYLFANIPAFGEDSTFGTVFPIYLEEWEEDIEHGRRFSTLHVDKEGYPINGHLIWAGTDWWSQQFEKHGLHREVEIERALHQKYDEYMGKSSVARKAYYVFSKNARQEASQAVIERIYSTPSQALQGW
ncbi:MAG: class I SAM-dependent methyltransferase [Chloroflexota bacterium]|nr:class I SAM-dependent methyltransferase [Chloroflexota bacterium]